MFSCKAQDCKCVCIFIKAYMLADILLKTNKLLPVHKAVNKENVKRLLFSIFSFVYCVYI